MNSLPEFFVPLDSIEAVSELMTLDEYILLMDGTRTLLEVEIAEFETTLPDTLPADYRDFLQKTNGGGISLEIDLCTPVASNGYDEFTGPMSVFGIDGKDLLQKNRVCYSGHIPRELAMIASDCFGNGICVGITGEARGKIYLWDHELECGNGDDWDGSVISCEASTLHTNSFAECLAGSYIGDGEI
ncbi:MAG: SMI1/KNR4 family protein [Planctomycetota bacterium]|nr:SMI1/KNR4 family protein [Planctomycetota bacterium]